MRERVAVIGAGIGGLSAAALLAAKGFDVTVFEKNATPGGKMSERVIEGYRFDTGPSLLTMPFVLERLFRECGHELKDHLKLLPLHPNCRYHWSDGTVFDCTDDIAATQESIRAFAPEDADAYADFLRYSGQLYTRTADAFLFNKLNTWSDFKRLNVLDLLRIDALTTVSDRVDSRFKSRHMRQFFKRFTTYNGSSPYLAPATLNVIPYVELVQGGYYVKGGLYAVAKALETLAIACGATIRYGADIQRIDVRNGRVAGVDGEAFDRVVSNSDATDTYTRLLGDDVIPPRNKRAMAAIEPSCSGFVMLLGLDRRYQSAHHNIWFSDDYKTEFDDIFTRRKLPSDPTLYIADTSHTDPSHAPDGGANWFVLVNAPHVAGQDWEALRESYAEHILRELRLRVDGGITAHIRVKEVITPADFLERYRSNKGSIYGTSSNSRLAAFIRPRNASPNVKGLYLVGGSTHPGGGIPLCVLSAFHAVSSL